MSEMVHRALAWALDAFGDSHRSVGRAGNVIVFVVDLIDVEEQ